MKSSEMIREMSQFKGNSIVRINEVCCKYRREGFLMKY